MTDRPIRVLMAKPGLDGHDVGVKVVSRALMDAGMEVIYTGLRTAPATIAAAAAAEDPDVIGLSVLSGAHLPLAKKVVDELAELQVEGVLLIAGGNIPAQDHAAMEDLGFKGIFPTGTPLEDIVDYINLEVVR